MYYCVFLEPSFRLLFFHLSPLSLPNVSLPLRTLQWLALLLLLNTHVGWLGRREGERERGRVVLSGLEDKKLIAQEDMNPNEVEQN